MRELDRPNGGRELDQSKIHELDRISKGLEKEKDEKVNFICDLIGIRWSISTGPTTEMEIEVAPLLLLQMKTHSMKDTASATPADKTTTADADAAAAAIEIKIETETIAMVR